MERFGRLVRVVEGYAQHEFVAARKKVCPKTVDPCLFTVMLSNPKTRACQLMAMKSPRSAHVCCHDLPTRGFCVLSRSVYNGKTLLMQSLPPMTRAKEISSTMMLRFATTEDLLMWEQKLRSQLEVYSYDVTEFFGFRDSISSATLHITSVYVVLTRFNEDGQNLVLLQHMLKTSSVSFSILDQTNACLSIEMSSGDVYSYNFKTNHAASIQKALGIFHTLSDGDAVPTAALSSTASYPRQSINTPLIGSEENASNCNGTHMPPAIPKRIRDVTLKASTVGSSDVSGDVQEINGSPKEDDYLALVDNESDNSENVYDTPGPMGPRPAGLKQKKTSMHAVENSDGNSNYINSYKATIPTCPNRYCYIGERTRDDKYAGLTIVRMGQPSGAAGHRYPHWKPSPGVMLPDALTKPVKEKMPFSQEESVDVTVCIVASKAVANEFWVVAVLLTRRQDEELMKKLLDVEKESGRHRVTTSLALKASSDMELCIDNCPHGFENLSGEKQVVSFEDCKMLSQNSWLVVEFHFLHNDANHMKFVSAMVVSQKSSPMGGGTSIFKSKKIMICESFKLVDGTPNHKVDGVTTSTAIKDDQSPVNFKSVVKREPKSVLGLFQFASERSAFCQKLEQFHPLGKDWKLFAIELGLAEDEVNHIAASRGSFMEQVLLVLETSCSSVYTVANFREIATRLNRRDLLCYLHLEDTSH